MVSYAIRACSLASTSVIRRRSDSHSVLYAVSYASRYVPSQIRHNSCLLSCLQECLNLLLVRSLLLMPRARAATWSARPPTESTSPSAAVDVHLTLRFDLDAIS